MAAAVSVFGPAFGDDSSLLPDFSTFAEDSNLNGTVGGDDVSALRRNFGADWIF